MRQLFGAITEYEKSMIVLKLRGARERERAKNGRCEGRKAYGFRPGEQVVVERIVKLRNEKKPLDAIAKTLNREGVKPRTSSLWYASTIRNVLIKATEASSACKAP
jgi:hypothetical protein